MRGPSLEQSGNSCRKRVRIAPHEHMHMVWLNSEFHPAPLVFCCYFLNDLLQSIAYWTNQDVPSPLWTENDRIDNQMNMMVLMAVFQVDTLPENDKFSKDVLPHPCPNTKRLFIPRMNHGGFQAQLSVKNAILLVYLYR
jgi:hypothetical protein